MEMSMANRRRYHHGDLRDVLIRAANDVLKTDGVQSLSIRGIARAAGVSQAAPYHHFKDRQALLRAVAMQGHIELRRVTRQYTANEVDPYQRLRKIGIAYLLFAYDNPDQFGLMFSREVSNSQTLEQADIVNENLTTLRAALGDLLGIDAEAKDCRLEHAVLTAWSLVHGLAMLVVEDRVVYPKDNREAFIKFASQVLGIVDYSRLSKETSLQEKE